MGLAALGGISEGRMRNLLNPRFKSRGGRVGYKKAIEWLSQGRQRATFVPSRWRRQDGAEPLPPAEPDYLFVPVSMRRQRFKPDSLDENGLYLVGRSREAWEFDDYWEALDALKAMRRPAWRQRGEDGRWGVVDGARWVRVARSAFLKNT